MKDKESSVEFEPYGKEWECEFLKLRKNHMADLFKKVMLSQQWISTKERLPEHNVSVLVFIPEEDDHCTTGMYDISGKWVLLDEYRVPKSQVTYWRKMVDLPEDKGYERQRHFTSEEEETVTYQMRELQKENFELKRRLREIIPGLG